MSGVDLLALAERVEASAGADVVELSILNGEILRALGWTSDRHGAYDPDGSRVIGVPDLTRSIDGALTLVPEGRDWMIDNFDGPPDRRCSASVFNAKGDDYADYEAFAATPALALCAAALRARHQSAAGEGK